MEVEMEVSTVIRRWTEYLCCGAGGWNVCTWIRWRCVGRVVKDAPVLYFAGAAREGGKDGAAGTWRITLRDRRSKNRGNGTGRSTGSCPVSSLVGIVFDTALSCSTIYCLYCTGIWYAKHHSWNSSFFIGFLAVENMSSSWEIVTLGFCTNSNGRFWYPVDWCTVYILG